MKLFRSMMLSAAIQTNHTAKMAQKRSCGQSARKCRKVCITNASPAVAEIASFRLSNVVMPNF